MTTFKPITSEDIDRIVIMMREFYAIDGYPIDVEKSKKLFSEFIANENHGKAWVIWNDNQPVGYAIITFVFSFEYGGRIGFIDELYVSENVRGQGIGKATVAFLLTEATRLSLKLLYLEVEHHNSNAQKLYLSAGFSLHNRKILRYKIE